MTINMPAHNGKNGHHPPQDVPLPPTGDSAIFDPLSVESLANQFYTAVPNGSGVAAPAGTQPAVETIGTVPPSEINSSGMSGVALVGNLVGHSAPASAGSEDALTAMAKQLRSQMLTANLEANLFQAFAQLEPGSHSRETAVALPTTSASSDALNVEALKEVAQQMYAQIPQISPSGIPGNSIPAPPRPTSIFPLSEPDLQRAFADAGAQASHSPVRETPQPSFYFLSPPAVENLGLESGAIFDVSAIRKDFPILHQKVNGKPLIWLDNAATTQKPQSVIDALSLFYQRDNSNIHRGAHTLAARATDAYEGAREKVQRFLGASSASEIIFARGTTEAINLVAQTWGRKYIQPGDEIVLSTLEHHANIVPWQMLAQETGAILKVIPVTDSGEIMQEEYARLLGPRTRLVGITQVSNALGTIVPVREMTEIAHRHGAVVLVDGAQAVSHMPVNVQEIGCDFYTFSGHKLFAPTGIGVLYAKREILEDMPPWQGGGSMIRHVTFERTIYSEPPAKFEAGTPNIADAVGLGAAIDYITRLGMSNIERYEHQLTEYAIKRLAQIPGLRLIGTAPHKVSVVSFILDDIPVEQVGQRLAREGIAVRAGHHCAQPTMQRYNLTGTVRPSLAFYNTCQEIDTLVEVLRTIRFR
jgi:cysteine desulfurase/selenocysteine lyase